MIDLLDLIPEKTIKCLDLGYVTLLDVMPRIVEEGQTADIAVAEAARKSYGKDTKAVSTNESLIRYLMRHKHSGPSEMVEFKFAMKLPIFVARQIIRTRTANVDELSLRYSVCPKEFYIPDQVRIQSKNNKQGGEEPADQNLNDDFNNALENICDNAYDEYTWYLDKGVSREQARMFLPVNAYTEWVWKIDCHNLLRLLGLRCDKHAQWETRQYANAILKLVEPLIPTTISAWNDYSEMRSAVLLTRLEVEAIRNHPHSLNNTLVEQIKSDNKRERAEWVEKAKKLGFIVQE